MDRRLLLRRSERQGRMWILLMLVIVSIFVLTLAGFQASVRH
jgi:hypothetical protein